jgi:serine/threonine protein kinase
MANFGRPLAAMHFNTSMVIIEARFQRDVVLVLGFAQHQLWVAQTSNPPRDRDPWNWTRRNDFAPRVLNMKNIMPRFHPESMTRVNGVESRPDVYVKQVTKILDIVRFAGGLQNLVTENMYTRMKKKEIRNLEKLKRHPHANIVQYLGVITDTEIQFPGMRAPMTLSHSLIVGVAFKKYDQTLEELVDSGARFNASTILADLEAGIRHLHSLDLVHCDIKPANLLIRNGRLVIADFDSCHRNGEMQRDKGGTRGWSVAIPGPDIARPALDWYGFGKICHWLERKGFGNPRPGVRYPSTEQILGLV